VPKTGERRFLLDGKGDLYIIVNEFLSRVHGVNKSSMRFFRSELFSFFRFCPISPCVLLIIPSGDRIESFPLLNEVKGIVIL
jgi:hypothetical protein